MHLRTLLSRATTAEANNMLTARLDAVLQSYNEHSNHHLRSDVLSLLDHTIRLAEGFASEQLSADDASTSIAMIGAIHSRMLIYLAGAKTRISGYSVRLASGEIYPGFFLSEPEAAATVNALSRIGVAATIVPTQLTSGVVTSPISQPAPQSLPAGAAEAQIPTVDGSLTPTVDGTSEPGTPSSMSGAPTGSPPLSPSDPLSEKKP